jgi:transposase-like protein
VPFPGDELATLPIVHYARNLLEMVSLAKCKELVAYLRGVFAAPDRKQTLAIASTVAEKWREKSREKVGCHLEEHIEECLTGFPSV